MQKAEAEAKFREASQLFKTRQYMDALQLLDELNIFFPDKREILHARVLCLRDLGQLTKAQYLCETLIKNFNNPEYHTLRAEITEQKIKSLKKSPTGLSNMPSSSDKETDVILPDVCESLPFFATGIKPHFIKTYPLLQSEQISGHQIRGSFLSISDLIQTDIGIIIYIYDMYSNYDYEQENSTLKRVQFFMLFGVLGPKLPDPEDEIRKKIVEMRRHKGIVPKFKKFIPADELEILPSSNLILRIKHGNERYEFQLHVDEQEWKTWHKNAIEKLAILEDSPREGSMADLLRWVTRPIRQKPPWVDNAISNLLKKDSNVLQKECEQFPKEIVNMLRNRLELIGTKDSLALAAAIKRKRFISGW